MDEELNLFPNPGPMRLGDYQRLLICERQLSKEENWIKESLKKIKQVRVALHVEQMQLNSLMRPERRVPPEDHYSEKTNKEAEVSNAKQLDEAESSQNTKQLDLSICNDLSKILSGEFCVDQESEESEEE